MLQSGRSKGERVMVFMKMPALPSSSPEEFAKAVGGGSPPLKPRVGGGGRGGGSPNLGDKSAQAGLGNPESKKPPSPDRTVKPQDTGSNQGSGGQDPNPGGSATDDWNILKGYLHLDDASVEQVASGQIRQINPSNQDMVRAAVIGRVQKSNFDATVALVKLLAYERFSPVKVINTMLANMAAFNSQSSRDRTWDLDMDGTRYVIKEEANLAEDVLFLINIFVTRGNNLRKILISVDNSVKEPLRSKMTAYKIKSDTDDEAQRRKRSEKIELTSKDITLSRIAASFPHISLAVVHKTGVVGKVDMTCIRVATFPNIWLREAMAEIRVILVNGCCLWGPVCSRLQGLVQLIIPVMAFDEETSSCCSPSHYI